LIGFCQRWAAISGGQRSAVGSDQRGAVMGGGQRWAVISGGQ